MKAPFLRRIAFALGLQHETAPEPADDRLEYFADFGPNVPVEDLGGQPVYPGREKAP